MLHVCIWNVSCKWTHTSSDILIDDIRNVANVIPFSLQKDQELLRRWKNSHHVMTDEKYLWSCAFPQGSLFWSSVTENVVKWFIPMSIWGFGSHYGFGGGGIILSQKWTFKSNLAINRTVKKRNFIVLFVDKWKKNTGQHKMLKKLS